MAKSIAQAKEEELRLLESAKQPNVVILGKTISGKYVPIKSDVDRNVAIALEKDNVGLLREDTFTARVIKCDTDSISGSVSVTNFPSDYPDSGTHSRLDTLHSDITSDQPRHITNAYDSVNDRFKVDVQATVNPPNLDVALSTRASESTLSSIDSKIVKCDTDNVTVSNFPSDYPDSTTHTKLDTINTTLQSNLPRKIIADDGSGSYAEIYRTGNNLNIQIKGDDVGLATESTLAGIKTQTDKLTFDTNNYLIVVLGVKKPDWWTGEFPAKDITNPPNNELLGSITYDFAEVSPTINLPIIIKVTLEVENTDTTTYRNIGFVALQDIPVGQAPIQPCGSAIFRIPKSSVRWLKGYIFPWFTSGTIYVYVWGESTSVRVNWGEWEFSYANPYVYQFAFSPRRVYEAEVLLGAGTVGFELAASGNRYKYKSDTGWVTIGPYSRYYPLGSNAKFIFRMKVSDNSATSNIIQVDAVENNGVYVVFRDYLKGTDFSAAGQWQTFEFTGRLPSHGSGLEVRVKHLTTTETVYVDYMIMEII